MSDNVCAPIRDLLGRAPTKACASGLLPEVPKQLALEPHERNECGDYAADTAMALAEGVPQEMTCAQAADEAEET